jgi:serine/threonine protein kinase
MTPAQWQKIKEITADALEREPADREDFVADACSGDSLVYREVLQLVSEAEKSDRDFLSRPPAQLRQLLQYHLDSTPCFSPGQVLAGRFEILQFLNRGGMGEVYSAMDLELEEKLALKTIHPAIASSMAVIERFKQEVRQTRRIAHPNVCRVYDLFCHELPDRRPAWFLTMELLEGQTLAERISAGPLPLKRALPLIRDMVSALSAAHDVGIVHRDFKPNNVMLVAAGATTERAVVTDFGLAANVDSRDTAGTPAYIAPEQAAGGDTGCAADQFSLGLVIAEILVGKRPVLDRKSAVEAKRQLESWFSVMPRNLLNTDARSAITRSLAFRPEERFRDVRAVLSSLDGSKRRRRSKAFWGIAAAAVTAMAAVVIQTESGDRLTDLRSLTPGADWSLSPSLSSDGKWIAYASNREEAGNVDIWIDSSRGGAARRLTTDPAEDKEPNIAPDGKSVVFRSDRNADGVYWVGSDGAGERLLVAGGRSPVFSPDGRWVAYWNGDPDDSVASGRLFVVSPQGGPPRRIAPDFMVARYPLWSPDGRYLAFEGCRENTSPFPACTELWIAPADGSSVVSTGALAALRTLNVSSFRHQKAWRDTRILFGGRRTGVDALWEATISSQDLRLSGVPRQVTSGEAGEREPTLADNDVIAFGRLFGPLHIWRLGLRPPGEPARAAKVTDATFGECCPAASADGRSLFFTRLVHDVKELFRKDLMTGAESVILASPEDKSWPVPSRDGTRVIFEARRRNETSIDLFVQGQPPRKLCVGCSHPTSWFGDNAVFHTTATGNLGTVNIDTGVSRDVPFERGRMTLSEADWSPENQYLLVAASPNGASKRIYAVRFPQSAASPDGPWVLLTPESQGAEKPRWSQDGKIFYYLSNRDGFLCVWGQGFAPGEKRPLNKPFPVMHYHDYPRFSPNRVGIPTRGFTVAGESIFLNVGEGIETIWVGKLEHPSVLSFFRDRFFARFF